MAVLRCIRFMPPFSLATQEFLQFISRTNTSSLQVTHRNGSYGGVRVAWQALAIELKHTCLHMHHQAECVAFTRGAGSCAAAAAQL